MLSRSGATFDTLSTVRDTHAPPLDVVSTLTFNYTTTCKHGPLPWCVPSPVGAARPLFAHAPTLQVAPPPARRRAPPRAPRPRRRRGPVRAHARAQPVSRALTVASAPRAAAPPPATHHNAPSGGGMMSGLAGMVMQGALQVGRRVSLVARSGEGATRGAARSAARAAPPARGAAAARPPRRRSTGVMPGRSGNAGVATLPRAAISIRLGYPRID